jgi:hypothetical protein
MIASSQAAPRMAVALMLIDIEKPRSAGVS